MIRGQFIPARRPVSWEARRLKAKRKLKNGSDPNLNLNLDRINRMKMMDGSIK